MIVTKIKTIKNCEEDKDLLTKFLTINENATKTFRYYNKRNFNVISDHIYTALYFDGDNVIGYGHLDKGTANVWLGIIVSDNYRGLGVGSEIIDDLIVNYNGEITLSVDKGNLPAINLYKKKKFTTINTTDKIIIMRLKK
jgi:ribosomal protein S18 acetylase RimI-like enzyme